MRIGIFTLSEDLHGYLVAEQLHKSGHQAHIIATDKLAFSPWLEWRGPEAHASITDIHGAIINCSEIDTIWWRRVNSSIQHMPDLQNDAASKLIPNENKAALLGTLLTAFSGRWVNDPAVEIRADNKLVQLQAAKKVGFTVPDTLVSSVPPTIRNFVKEHRGHVVVKVVRGLADFSVPARVVGLSDLNEDESLNACPSIWQAVVQGDSHLRVHVFGKRIMAVNITSNKLDWRPDLTAPMTEYTLSPDLESKCHKLLQALGLEMGIIDIKLTPNNEPVFLEINPQGQFGFIEGITGLPLSALMASCLTQNPPSNKRRRSARRPGHPAISGANPSPPPNARGGASAPGALRLPGLQLMAQPTVIAPVANATSLRQLDELIKATELKLDGQPQR